MPERYRTIVADPPWDHSDGTGVRIGRGDSRYGNWVEGEDAEATAPPYSMMPLADIIGLPVSSLAQDDAHLYLWTTQRYLRPSFDVVEAWGFSVSATLVWCKQPRGFNPGGTFGSTIEFAHFCRRGSLAAKRKIPQRWFTWPRTLAPPVARGQKRNQMHSAKPEAFIDMVEQVSPGPYLEMFARRARFGWDYFGDESLGTAEVAA